MKRILTPVDFSNTSKKALKYAASMVQMNNGELFLLYVQRKKSALELPNSVSDLSDLAEDLEYYKNLLEETAVEIRNEYSIPVRTIVGIGGRISEILNHAEKKEVGLIVMGTEGSESASSLFSGSNSHRVVSKSQIPVMTIRSDGKKTQFENILLPLDLSEHTRQKVNVAIQIAKMHKANIHLLGVLSSGEESEKGKLAAIMHQVTKRIAEDNISVSSDMVTTSNFAGKTMAHVKRSKADMIITMTDQHNGSGLFSGNFDRELVDESDVPVLSIPPEIHEENMNSVSIGGL